MWSTVLLLLSVLPCVTGLVTTASAATITFESHVLVAQIHTRGQYDDAGLGTWNGSPLSETNRPTFDEDQLSSDVNLYVNPALTNSLFVEVKNVQDTAYGY